MSSFLPTVRNMLLISLLPTADGLKRLSQQGEKLQDELEELDAALVKRNKVRTASIQCWGTTLPDRLSRICSYISISISAAALLPFFLSQI